MSDIAILHGPPIEAAFFCPLFFWKGLLRRSAGQWQRMFCHLI